MLLIKNIGKSYGAKKIVKNIYIEVPPFAITGLLGPNGAGKTTSFYMIAGLIKPDYGNILLNGIDITNIPMYMRARYGISYLSQESSIFRGMTVYQNIMVAVQMKEKDKKKCEDKVNKLMEEFSIIHLHNINAENLSGGEKRRLEIARCIGSEPKYLLLDEPLAGIDPIAVHEIKEIIKKLIKYKIGILITDHNVKDALKIIDYSYIIYDGSILAEGTTSDIIKNKNVKKFYLGENFK